MLIDCDTCQVRGPACQDCVVTVLLGPVPELGMQLDGDEQAAIAVLAQSGLVPPLRLVPGSDLPPAAGESSRDGDAHVKRRASG